MTMARTAQHLTPLGKHWRPADRMDPLGQTCRQLEVWASQNPPPKTKKNAGVTVGAHVAACKRRTLQQGNDGLSVWVLDVVTH